MPPSSLIKGDGRKVLVKVNRGAREISALACHTQSPGTFTSHQCKTFHCPQSSAHHTEDVVEALSSTETGRKDVRSSAWRYMCKQHQENVVSPAEFALVEALTKRDSIIRSYLEPFTRCRQCHSHDGGSAAMDAEAIAFPDQHTIPEFTILSGAIMAIARSVESVGYTSVHVHVPDVGQARERADNQATRCWLCPSQCIIRSVFE